MGSNLGSLVAKGVSDGGNDVFKMIWETSNQDVFAEIAWSVHGCSVEVHAPRIELHADPWSVFRLLELDYGSDEMVVEGEISQ